MLRRLGCLILLLGGLAGSAIGVAIFNRLKELEPFANISYLWKTGIFLRRISADKPILLGALFRAIGTPNAPIIQQDLLPRRGFCIGVAQK